jgi:hypothetical protein
MGKMQVADETLELEKDVIELPVSTCDIVTILNTNFSVDVSRINFNNYDSGNISIVSYPDLASFPAVGEVDTIYIAEDTKLIYKWTGAYVAILIEGVDALYFTQNDEIDARIVYVDHTKQEYSPPYEKRFGLRLIPDTAVVTSWIDSPKKASSLEVSFSYLINYYASLSRLLTKVNLRKAKFNLPVYEVAGLKHYIPIYLSQYKAYFYVNKINNYVPGKLCTIDLIKL